MIFADGFAAEAAVASDIVYVEGPVLALLIFGFVFVFVAMTDNYWFIGAGVFVILVSTLFAWFSWRSLADYPLVYRAGDRPSDETEGSGLYDKWKLGAGASVRTTFAVAGAANAESLTSSLFLGYGCRDARVDWRIDAADGPLASGSFRQGQERDLTDVPVRRTRSPIVVTLSATRVDAAACPVDLIWHNPGLEGPGNGKLRFVFPIPETD